jgi:hypothetical protein
VSEERGGGRRKKNWIAEEQGEKSARKFPSFRKKKHVIVKMQARNSI